MTIQAVATISNTQSLCICEITREEAEQAQQDNPLFDGYGLYLVAVDKQKPRSPGRVLAKFASEDAAKSVAQFLRVRGLTETI